MGARQSRHRAAKSGHSSSLAGHGHGGHQAKTGGSKSITELKIKSTDSTALSDPGFGADEDENQDVALATTLLPGLSPCYLAGLFDGHGPEGRAVAALIKERILLTLGVSSNTNAATLKKCFTELDSACVGIDVDSGVSATVLFFDENDRRLIIANVGDTKAVLGRGIHQPRVLQLSEDHYPAVEQERLRIVEAGGRVAAAVDVQLGEIGVMRVWKGDEGRPGLPLSRSIGDSLAKEVGVTSDPHITEMKLEAQDRFLIIGTGGVWKVLTPQEAVDLVANQHDAKQAAKKVIDEAKRRWEQLWQGENTSVLVVVFPGP
uniref:PPM-type phosphatase domain-containing protein n=1 Tax=Chrysotila carterae TaxID=13221 RepID=A0A7S4BIT3_CHRCT|mmetsp:Transcript_2059/g.4315  ORF Transcript_2059/g.4315 Transcript_2059/m.4315 type:complete len:318 (+) Transcript_2059:471-1424(+)